MAVQFQKEQDCIFHNFIKCYMLSLQSVGLNYLILNLRQNKITRKSTHRCASRQRKVRQLRREEKRRGERRKVFGEGEYFLEEEKKN